MKTVQFGRRRIDNLKRCIIKSHKKLFFEPSGPRPTVFESLTKTYHERLESAGSFEQIF